MIGAMSTTRDGSEAAFQDSLELDHARAAREARAAIAHDTAEAAAVSGFRAFVAGFATQPHPADLRTRPLRVSRPVRSFAGAGQHGMETIDDPQGRQGWQISVSAASVDHGQPHTYLVGTDGHVYAVHDTQDDPVPSPAPELLAALEQTLAREANPLT